MSLMTQSIQVNTDKFPVGVLRKKEIFYSNITALCVYVQPFYPFPHCYILLTYYFSFNNFSQSNLWPNYNILSYYKNIFYSLYVNGQDVVYRLQNPLFDLTFWYTNLRYLSGSWFAKHVFKIIYLYIYILFYFFLYQKDVYAQLVVVIQLLYAAFPDGFFFFPFCVVTGNQFHRKYYYYIFSLFPKKNLISTQYYAGTRMINNLLYSHQMFSHVFFTLDLL